MDKATSLTTMPDISYPALGAQLAAADDGYGAIVNVPFENTVAMAWLFLGFICLYIVDEAGKVAFIAASDTEQYRMSVERYNFDGSQYRLDFMLDEDNTIVQAIATQQVQDTSDWATMGRKGAKPEAVRLNQASSGIAYSAVYPFAGSVRGALMYNFYQYHEKLGHAQRSFMERYTQLVADYFAAHSPSA